VQAKQTDYVNSDKRPSPHGRLQDKVEAYGWKVVDKPGRFMWLPKTQLNIDHEYQRDNVANKRVLRLTAEWSWVSCGVLTIGQRADGTFWVMDGQHRKLAADKRSDITTLPCLVFDVAGKSQEARGFIALNTERGPVQAIDKFNAQVMAEDATAIAVKDLVERDGYVISRAPGDRTVRCVGTIASAIRQDPASAKIAWDFAVQLHNGKPIIDRVFDAIYATERYLKSRKFGSLNDPHNTEALLRCSVQEIMQSINAATAYHGGGPKAGSEGLIRLLNKGRRSRRITSPYGESESSA
jgi:hypothetical protein